MISTAIRSKLMQNLVLQPLISTYNFGTIEQAIFTTSSLPQNATLPAILITELGGTNWGTRGSRGLNCRIQIRLFGDRYNNHNLNQAAWEIYDSLDRADLTIAGYDLITCNCEAPQFIEDETGSPGYILFADVSIIE